MEKTNRNTVKNEAQKNSSNHYIPDGETDTMIREKAPHCSICDALDNLKAFKGKYICSPCIQLFQEL